VSSVTIVIPIRVTKSHPRSIDRLIVSLDGARRGSGHVLEDIIVVDSCSDQPYRRRIRRVCSDYQARFVMSDVRFPWNQGRILNGGMRMADTEYVMRMDCDIILSKGFWQAVERKVSPTLFLLSNTFFLTEEPPKGFISWGDDERERWLKGHNKGTRIGAKGGVQIFSREWFNRVQGYDECFELWGSDDEDMVNRAKRSGLKIRRVARNYHIPHRNTRVALDPTGKQRWKNHARKTKSSPKLPIKRNEDLGREWGLV